MQTKWHISTHSLKKRLTEYIAAHDDVINISTHSLKKRLTPPASHTSSLYYYFNSQPQEEADLERLITVQGGKHFNSQPQEEADL